MLVLPQIPKFLAVDLAAKLGAMSVAEARRNRGVDHPLKSYSPVGGTRSNEEQISRLVDSIELIARNHGYPGERPKSWGDFDREAAELLFKRLTITAHEASKAGTWMFLACVAMPDLVIWRQKKGESTVKADNFLDTSNNVFRRLWWRARIFWDTSKGGEHLWLLDVLLEDAVQGFYERASLSGCHGLGPIFGAVYDATARLMLPRKNMEPVERTAQKLLVRIGENVALEFADTPQRMEIMAEIFSRSIPPDSGATVSADQILEIMARNPGLPCPEPAPAPEITPEAVSEVVYAEPSTPDRAVAFDDALLKAFRADAGAYSVVTMREADASEVNLTGPEAKIIEAHFGTERIHVGPVRSNPQAARQSFRVYPSDEVVFLNLVYPKQDSREIRLYLSSQKGFRPVGGSIWFLFRRKRDIYIGSMSQEDWKSKLKPRI